MNNRPIEGSSTRLMALPKQSGGPHPQGSVNLPRTWSVSPGLRSQFLSPDTDPQLVPGQSLLAASWGPQGESTPNIHIQVVARTHYDGSRVPPQDPSYGNLSQDPPKAASFFGGLIDMAKREPLKFAELLLKTAAHSAVGFYCGNITGGVVSLLVGGSTPLWLPLAASVILSVYAGKKILSEGVQDRNRLSRLATNTYEETVVRMMEEERARREARERLGFRDSETN